METTAIAIELKITVPDAKSIIQSLFVKGFVGNERVDIYAAHLFSPDALPVVGIPVATRKTAAPGLAQERR